MEKQFYDVTFDFGYYNKMNNFFHRNEVREIVLAESPTQALEYVEKFYTSTFKENDKCIWYFENWSVGKMTYMTAY